jgi:hypothetical protein
MGLLDRFRKPDELLEWMKDAYRLAPAARGETWTWSGSAHGRTLKLRTESPGRERDELPIWIFPEGMPEQDGEQLFKFFREQALAPDVVRVLPSITDPDWPERTHDEDPMSLKVGGGFLLDWDFDVESPVLRRHGVELAPYLERFSPATSRAYMELPWMVLGLKAEGLTPSVVKRDVECAHEFLAFFEERRALWRAP